jgi:hypothetical protein
LTVQLVSLNCNGAYHCKYFASLLSVWFLSNVRSITNVPSYFWKIISRIYMQKQCSINSLKRKLSCMIY